MGQDQSQNKFLFMLCITSEGKMWRYVFLVVLFSQTLTALQIPKWSDVFSSLEPYKDPETLLLEEEDAGEARLGFVQLNSGSTSFNATLNLTGHILLGLGIASSLLLYMFFNAFDEVGSDSGGYGHGFFKNKRSVDDLSAVLDEAIIAHSFGAMDVKTCGDKVWKMLCPNFLHTLCAIWCGKSLGTAENFWISNDVSIFRRVFVRLRRNRLRRSSILRYRKLDSFQTYLM